MMPKIRPSGGYRGLRSFQVATVIYDATYWFCERFLDQRFRMCDQMVQAARSGRQNIAEGSRASATSSQTELRLLNVARASLEELLLDYEDFLRHRKYHQWSPESPDAMSVRTAMQKNRTDQTDQSDNSLASLYAKWLESADPAVRANALICLINQANYLLDKQIASLERAFIEQGGYSEQLAAARLKSRVARVKDQSDRSHQSDDIPVCPKCGGPMVLRTSKRGERAGGQFWGCAAFPECDGIVSL